jgi:hypothetical protein
MKMIARKNFFKNIVLLALVSLLSLVANAGQRTFYWTGSGAGESAELCFANARNDGYVKAVDSCSRDHGLRYELCQSGFISDEKVMVPFSPYTGTCALRVFVTVTY